MAVPKNIAFTMHFFASIMNLMATAHSVPSMAPGTGRGGGLALTGICLGFFVVLFDATAVNVATGGIASGLGASLVTVQWVLNAYTVAFAALMLTAGGLGDRCGARRVYQAGATLFAVSSAVCAAAPDVTVLIAARVTQGIGASAVVPCSLALIAHRYPEGTARTRALGIWGGVSGIGLTAGPVAGGWLVAALGWRSVFLVVVPVSAVSIAITAARGGEAPRRASARPDLPGQLLAIASLIALTGSLTMTATLGWRSPLVLGLLAVAVAAGASFVIAEHRVSDPMLPPSLFTSRAFSGATVLGLLFNFGLYGLLFCVTIFLERTLREPAAITGLALAPLTAVVALCALVSGRLTSRLGPRLPMIAGLSGGLLGSCLLATGGDRAGPVAIAVYGAIIGCAGLCMPAMTGVALGAAGPRQAGLGAATLNAARQAGGALGVALLGSTALRRPADGAAALPQLRLPGILAAIGYVIALVVTIIATRGPRRAGSPGGPGATCPCHHRPAGPRRSRTGHRRRPGR
jgi:MFS transporter, DHA2 family, methylenomycin A resistance protein